MWIPTEHEKYGVGKFIARVCFCVEREGGVGEEEKKKVLSSAITQAEGMGRGEKAAVCGLWILQICKNFSLL